jgi:hypothetical protein
MMIQIAKITLLATLVNVVTVLQTQAQPMLQTKSALCDEGQYSIPESSAATNTSTPNMVAPSEFQEVKLANENAFQQKADVNASPVYYQDFLYLQSIEDALSNFVKQSYLAIHAKQPTAIHTRKNRRNICINNNATDKYYQMA